MSVSKRWSREDIDDFDFPHQIFLVSILSFRFFPYLRFNLVMSYQNVSFGRVFPCPFLLTMSTFEWSPRLSESSRPREQRDLIVCFVATSTICCTPLLPFYILFSYSFSFLLCSGIIYMVCVVCGVCVCVCVCLSVCVFVHICYYRFTVKNGKNDFPSF